MLHTNRCIFCGGSGPFHKEDVLPKWISKTFPKSWVTITDIRSGRRFRAHGHLGIVSRAVCSGCNNGWMSILENDAKPIITPMILGQFKTISLDEQALLARWTMKTAAMLDVVSNAESRFFIEDDFSRLCKSFEIPNETRISVSRWSPSHVEVKTRTSSSEGTLPDGTSDFTALTVTIALGRLLLQLFCPRRKPSGPAYLLPLPDIAMPDHWIGIDLQIWPTVTGHISPPPLLIKEDDFEAFANRWNEFRWVLAQPK
jgi:hypothetical protein